jgi:hypothetical protein
VITSSQQQSYSITLDNSTGVLAQEVSDFADTIVLSSPTAVNSVYIGTSSYSNMGTVSISNIDTTEYTINWGNEEWVDRFPRWERIQDMCDEYPGLKIAFEKFKTTYKLVKDDYDTPKDKRKTP